jgi:uncharacterized Zn-binding protein involved in type VI secretion
MPGIARGNGSGDYALCTNHSCKRCAKCGEHTVQGPAKPGAGSPNVKINGFQALRIGDIGVHDKNTCCGPNQWIAMQNQGKSTVNINGKPAFLYGDITLHDQKDQGEMKAGPRKVTVVVKGT